MSRHRLPSDDLRSEDLPATSLPGTSRTGTSRTGTSRTGTSRTGTSRTGENTSRHSLADTPDIPDVAGAIPLPRAPMEFRRSAATDTSRIAVNLLGPTPAEPAPQRSRHAVIDEPVTDEPVTGPSPVVPVAASTEAPEAPVDAALSPELLPQRRHAAPQRHRRRAQGRDHDATARPGRGRRVLAGLGGGRRTAAVLLTAAVALVALPTAGSASVDQCRWQIAAHDLLVSLDGQTDARSTQLRKALTRAGVGTELPAECAAQAAAEQPSPPPSDSSTPTTPRHTPRTSTPKAPSNAAPTTTPAAPRTTAAPAPITSAPAAGTGAGTTAAAAMGWGTATKSDDFSAGLGQWGIYDGSGHAGNGRRTPSAVTTAGGVMTTTGDAGGNTGGMAWGSGQKYGRWEARVRSTTGSYHPVMLLWPDAENWPVGGEVDWMEISDPARQIADTFLHYGASNNQVSGNVEVDATQWHNWAVEWTPQGITTYLDGKVWWSTKNTSILPPGPMHMTIQLDNFGGRNTSTQMQVDWVKQYAP